jgi:ribose transport system substrate-binding protein
MDEQISGAGFGRRAFMAGAATLAASAALWPKEMRAAAAERTFAASLGWTTYDSGRHLQDGFNAAVKELGGRLTTTDAGFDARQQSDQIDSLIASKPEALFITPADAVAIAPAVQRAMA